MFDISKIKFDNNALVPAIVQDFYTKKVLMLAYMNKESVEISLKEKKTCFYSRSRNKLWRKGESSGNTQKIINMYSDCDNDAIIVEVIKAGPACHTGEESCFFNEIYTDASCNDFSIDNLYGLILERKTDTKENSYTSYLFDKGLDKILKKVGEESTEVVIAAKNSDNNEIIYEISDLVYHIMVLMAEKNISIEDIKKELAKRHIIDKKVKQEKMV